MTDNVVPARPPMPPVESLLQPIAPDRRAGDSIRLDGLFDELKRLREEEPNLPQGSWKRELKRAEWNELTARATETLQTRSKDLQVAGWLAEAWTHFHGFAGLDRGLELIAALCRDFWPDLHPGAGGDDDARGNAIEWLADTMRRAARNVPVTAPNREGEASYTWNDIDVADKTAKEKALVSASMTPAPWLASRAAEVERAVEAVEELDAIVTANLPEDIAPSLVKLRTTLEAIQKFFPVEDVGRALSPPTGRAESPSCVQEEKVDEGTIASRAEAYQRLREASDYLMRTEPHSPVPYLVRRAIGWGNLTLAELLEELLTKNADLQTIYTLLGMKGR
jgi:type VI secretion system protein ImpA